MNLEHYEYQNEEDSQEYSFFSNGPRGKIKKLVVFSMVRNEPPMYNLAFGDVDSETGEINDKVNSNNKDRDIVLATVANTINDFSDHHGNHYVFAIGSTPARTRLYQMGIAGLLDEIQNDFELWGYKDGDWHDFQRSVNYEAFLVKRK